MSRPEVDERQQPCTRSQIKELHTEGKEVHAQHNALVSSSKTSGILISLIALFVLIGEHDPKTGAEIGAAGFAIWFMVFIIGSVVWLLAPALPAVCYRLSRASGLHRPARFTNHRSN